MGEAPLPSENPPAIVAAEAGEQPPPAKSDAESAPPLSSSHLRRKSVLIEARIFQMNDDDLRKFTSGLALNGDLSGSNVWWSATPGQFASLLANLDTSHRPLIQRPRILTSDGMPAEFYVGDQTNSIELDCTPLVVDGSINLNFKSIAISGASANPLINQFSTITSVETGGGMVLRMDDQGGQADNNLVTVLSAEIITNTPQFQQRLQAIIKPASQIHGLAPADDSTNQLYVRTFWVDPRTFASSLKQVGVDLDDKTNSPARIVAGLRTFFDGLGVDMKSPPGKSVFYKNTTGLLFVRATENDLDLIERAMIALNTLPPQIHIKARFIYVPKGEDVSFDSLKFSDQCQRRQFHRNPFLDEHRGDFAQPGIA